MKLHFYSIYEEKYLNKYALFFHSIKNIWTILYYPIYTNQRISGAEDWFRF